MMVNTVIPGFCYFVAAVNKYSNYTHLVNVISPGVNKVVNIILSLRINV